ncbi:MAG: hypothetical protein H6Q89_5643, partial [Myxococcaceae bacterium]|nr:hypothetical protein [Myxococcaceae bacterium]
LSLCTGASAQEVDGGVSADDEKLLKEIEAQAAAPAVPAPAKAATGGFFSNLFNPAMSVNGLLLGSVTSLDNPLPDQVQTGVRLQEVELQLAANVDPYLSANLILAIPDGEGIGIEEGIVSLTPQPWGFSFRGGKIKVPFGRENTLHTHALPFVDKSLIGTAVFGEEGLNEVGGEVSYLLPLPWYLLATVSVLGGDNEVAFHSPNGRDLAGFAGLKNVFDLTDDATLEVGASYAIGNNVDRQVSQAFGGQLVFKWRPASDATTHSAVVTVEALYSRVPRLDTPRGPQTDVYGLYAYAQWQLAQRWYVGGRFEFLQPPGVDQPRDLRQSAILVFVPTEFSAVRLQGNVREPGGGGDPIVEGFLQINFTLGAHPAHSY